jgi:predicted lipid-binding transport protein (Tim44 family)
MKKDKGWMLLLVLVTLLAGSAIVVQEACARAGGARSSGSSGSRSYASPGRSTMAPRAPDQGASPAQPGGSGFLRSMGGGMLGGLFGGMLFSSLFGGSAGGIGGGGIGIFELLLLGAGGYFLYNAVTRRRREARAAAPQQGFEPQDAGDASLEDGIGQIRRTDRTFDEGHFKETAMDIFFRIQGAWTGRSLSAGNSPATAEMNGILQEDIERFLTKKQVNRLENIAVKNVEILEAWQESGQDFIRTLFSASLLDYTTDDATGDVVSGSKTSPVKFEECWTFTRIGSNGPWKLCAIRQV